MIKLNRASRGVLWTAIASTAVMALAPAVALAQPDDYVPAPPPGDYAEPPPGYEDGAYDNRYYQNDVRYAEEASRWAAENCIQERRNNAAAGAVIGGVLGAVVGSNVSGRGSRTEGAIVGGALGATAGAAIGSSSSSSVGCPPGYVVRQGAPAYYWAGPAVVTYAYPAWYRPWVWRGGRWVYRPYRVWYGENRRYWRPRHYRRHRR